MSFPLNAAQREAVHYLDGPLLVLAGAGSGKTRVITAKIAHLLARGHDAKRIAAITFTNKAAREMRERAAELLAREGKGDLAADVTISTFHALGLRIIRGDADALGLKSGFSILDPGDIEPIVAELLQTTDRARARAAQWKISAWKNALVSPAQAAKAAQERRRRGRRPGLPPLRRDAARLSGGGFRRPDRAARAAPRHAQGGRREVARALRAPAGRRIPGHQPGAVPAHPPAGRRARGIHRRRRRRSGDLRLARRDARQPRPAAEGLSVGQGDQARAELPVDGAHPALGERR